MGQGGFGKTFLAIDHSKTAQSCCLIKQFSPKNQGYREQAAVLFRQEVLRLKELGHHPAPHGNGDLSQCLVQEFIDGQNLPQRLAEEGAFPETAIRQLLTELLPVIQFVHNHRVIHRDIKPENMICPSRGPVVLVDFGAAKLATATASQRGTLIGSAGFTAPEQLMSKAVFASDLYSLGATCIHLLTQIPTFKLWNLQPVELLGTLIGHADEVTSITISPDGKMLISGSLDRTIKLWNLSTRGLLYTLTGHQKGVHSVATSSDGILVSASSDGTLNLWSLKASDQVDTLTGHIRRVYAVAISSDGNTIVSGSGDNTLKAWRR